MLRSVVLTALLAFSASAAAQDFDYNFFGVGYQRINLDDGTFDIDGDGIGLNGSFEIGESFFVGAAYGMGEFEEAGIEVDLDTWSLGFGWHTEVAENVDFVATLSYESVEASALGLSADEDGYGIGAGLRFQASDSVEVNGGINYIDLGDGDDTTFNIGALYGVTDSIDVGLSAEFGDDSSAYGINGRFYFGD